METLLRGIKQMSTGLKFTLERQIDTQRPYSLYRGEYKDRPVSVIKFKGALSEKVREAVPIIKNLTLPGLPRYLLSQSAGSAVYLVTEPMSLLAEHVRRGEHAAFMVFCLFRIREMLARLLKEHNLEITSFGSGEIVEGDLYVGEEGLVVLGGFEVKFRDSGEQREGDVHRLLAGVEKAFTGQRGYRDIEENLFFVLEREVAGYEKASPTERTNFAQLLKDNTRQLPECYKARIAGHFVSALCRKCEGEPGEPREGREEKERMAKIVFGLKHADPDPFVISLFKILDPDVRLFLLRALRAQKPFGKKLSPELVKAVFPEFKLGLVCSDDLLKMETIATVGCISAAIPEKIKAEILAIFLLAVTKGKGKEREEISRLCLEKAEDFLEADVNAFYKISVECISSSEKALKENGVSILDKIYSYIDPRFLSTQVVSLVSSQLLYEEAQEKSFLLLDKILLHLKSSRKDLLKVGWTTGIKGMLMKGQPSIKVSKSVKKKAAEEEDAWEDAEW